MVYFKDLKIVKSSTNNWWSPTCYFCKLEIKNGRKRFRIRLNQKECQIHICAICFNKINKSLRSDLNKMKKDMRQEIAERI